MRVIDDSIIKPLPSDELIKKLENVWRIIFPQSYKDFIKINNGCVPFEKIINCNGRKYVVDRFLCILDSPEGHEFGVYDIDVILTQIEDRLTDNEDLVGVELLPIIQLFAGDYICLDFKNDKGKVTVCLWSHEESGDLEPVTYFIANNFESFIEMLVE